MKKLLNFGFVMVAMASLVFISSCGDSEDPAPKGPTVSFNTGTGLISDDVQLNPGDAMAFKVTITKGDKNLDKLYIKEGNVKLTATFTEEGESPESTDEFDLSGSGPVVVSITGINASQNEGVTDYTIVAADKDGVEGSVKVTVQVTTESESPAVTEFTAVLMGAHQNATDGSFMDAATGTVYKVAEAASNDTKIDFIYYYGATNKASLAAPSDATVLEFNSLGVANWGTKNATKLSTVAGADYDSYTTNEELSAAVDAENPSGTLSNELSVNDVILFTTADGIKGAIKVTAITAETTGSITLSVKIES